MQAHATRRSPSPSWLDGRHAGRCLPDRTAKERVAVTSMVSLRPFRREFLLPSKLTDDELRRISAPTTVLLGDREVIYAGGPQAALARSQTLIPNVHALILPSAGHILTLDAPDVVVTEIKAR